MGHSAASHHVRHSSADAVAAALIHITRGKAFVTAAADGWVSVFDELAQSQDEREIERISLELSAAIASPVLGLLVHDSNVANYWLCEHGELRDRFCSRPEDWTRDGADHPERYEPDTAHLAELGGIAEDDVCNVLENEKATAQERIGALGELLGLGPRALMSFSQVAPDAAEVRLIDNDGSARSRLERLPSQDLVEAATWLDVEGARRLITDGADPSRKDEADCTPLHLVLRASDRQLLDEHCSSDEMRKLAAAVIADPGGEGTAREDSAARRARRQLEFTKALIDAGADLESCNELGQTPLMVAAEQGLIEAVRLLLDAGAKVDSIGTSGSPALFDAVAAGQVEIAKLLLERGANANFSGEDTWTPLHHAALAGSGEAIDLLAEAGAKLNVQDRTGRTPVMLAAEHGRKHGVRALVERGADVNKRSRDGDTAMTLARDGGHHAIVLTLLRAGAKRK